MDVWRNSPQEYVAQCGWDLVTLAALNDKDLPDTPFATTIERIEKGIRSAPNRVRHAMNNALIAIGLRSDSLRHKALAAASRIGKVNVDHGQTGCKTPDAAEYITKTIAHRAKKAGA
jgi:3-methyladenine DNA glycosylase AlkD